MAKKAKQAKSRQKMLVLDSSVALSWFFKDEENAYAEAVQDALAVCHAMVPSLWPLEIANILVVGERRKRSTAAQAATWLGYLRLLPIRVDEETAARAWSDTPSLARSHLLSVYDAAYLELALRRGLSLATLDDRLKAAAKAEGVAEFSY